MAIYCNIMAQSKTAQEQDTFRYGCPELRFSDAVAMPLCCSYSCVSRGHGIVCTSIQLNRNYAAGIPRM